MAQITAEDHPSTPITSIETARRAFSSEAANPTVLRVGFWSAIAMSATYIIFFVSAALGSAGFIKPPWDVYIPIGTSIIIAPSFVFLIISVHFITPEAKRIWSLAALACAILYTAFVSVVYITWLFVWEPHVMNHTQNQVALLTNATGSFMEMVDGLGYTYMSIAILLTAPLFAGGRLAEWIRWFAILNGPIAATVLLAYITQVAAVGIGALLVPLYGILLAIYFNNGKTRPAVPSAEE